MKFSPKCRTKKSGMIYTIFGSFCFFLNWDRADILPQIRPRKIPDLELKRWTELTTSIFADTFVLNMDKGYFPKTSLDDSISSGGRSTIAETCLSMLNPVQTVQKPIVQEQLTRIACTFIAITQQQGLTHLCLMEFPTVTIWTSPYPF